MRRFLIATVVGLCAFGTRADGLEEFWNSAFWNPMELKKACGLDFMSLTAGGDVRSAYLSRAKVCEARPMSAQYATADIPLDRVAPVGRLGVDFWTISSLTRKMADSYEDRFFHERDFTLRYGYDWQIADEWRLSSDVMRTWVNLPGYLHGADHSSQEWRCAQRLDNPWITPYYLMRRCVHPRDWLYVRAGVQHVFHVTETLSLTPNFYAEFGNENHYQQRYGAKDPPWSKYHGGVQALNAVLTLSWKVTGWASLFASVQQFDMVDADARDRTKARKTPNARRDLTVGTVGVICRF